jgi:hypothetical protein
MGTHPIVDERIARATIARIQQLAVDQCDVGNATYVENRKRLLESAGANHGSMIGGSKRCSLAAMDHVVLAKVVYDAPAERVGHSLAVTELPGFACLWIVSDGLTVKTDDVDGAQLDIPTGAQGEDCLGLQVGELPFDARDLPIIRGKPQEPLAKLGRVTCARVGADCQTGIPVGFEHRGINSVHGRAAHEPNGLELIP